MALCFHGPIQTLESVLKNLKLACTKLAKKVSKYIFSVKITTLVSILPFVCHDWETSCFVEQAGISPRRVFVFCLGTLY